MGSTELSSRRRVSLPWCKCTLNVNLPLSKLYLTFDSGEYDCSVFIFFYFLSSFVLHLKVYRRGLEKLLQHVLTLLNKKTWFWEKTFLWFVMLISFQKSQTSWFLHLYVNLFFSCGKFILVGEGLPWYLISLRTEKASILLFLHFWGWVNNQSCRRSLALHLLH